MTYVDLTHTLDARTPLGGPIPPVEIKPLWELGREPANVSLCGFASHTGTHIDAPRHFLAAGRELAEIPLDWLCGTAALVDVPREAGTAISGEALEEAGRHVRRGDRLLLRCGFSAHFHDEVYGHHPYLEESAAEWLVERGVRVVALDVVSPERPPRLRPPDFAFPVHHRLLSADVLIVENAKLDLDLPERFPVSILPLKVAAPDGAPVRIVGVVEQ